MAKYAWRRGRRNYDRTKMGDIEIATRMPGTKYMPSEKAAMTVRRLAMLGVPQHLIAHKIGVDSKTLRKYYREDLDTGDLEAFASVAGALWNNAVKNNNVIAQIFWMKARHGWVDKKEVSHTHTVGPQLSHEERLKLLEADPPPDVKDPVQRTEFVDAAFEMVREGSIEETDDVAEQMESEATITVESEDE